MSPSRRTILRAAGVTVVAGVAGCGGDAGSSVGGSNSSGGTGSTPTTAAGRTYAVEVHNRIPAPELAAMPHVEKSDPASFSLKVDRSPAGSETGSGSTLVFERSLDLPPRSSKTVSDAFSTEDGFEYVLVAELSQFVEGDGPGDYLDNYRFVPGEFQTPDDDVLYVTVRDSRGGKFLVPEVTVADDDPRSG